MERPERISNSTSQSKGGLAIIGKGTLRIFLDGTSKSSSFHKDSVVPKRKLVLCVLFHQVKFLIFLYGSCKSSKGLLITSVGQNSHWKFLCILAWTVLKPAAATTKLYAYVLNFFLSKTLFH